MGAMFDTAFRRFSAAFERRADQVYGAQPVLARLRCFGPMCSLRQAFEKRQRFGDRAQPHAAASDLARSAAARTPGRPRLAAAK